MVRSLKMKGRCKIVIHDGVDAVDDAKCAAANNFVALNRSHAIGAVVYRHVRFHH